MWWFAAFALLFLSSLVLVGIQSRERVRAARVNPSYRYLWFVSIAIRTAVILLAIISGRYFAIHFLIIAYFGLVVIVGLPLASSILVRLYYCPRVESRTGNVVFRILSLVLAAATTFAISHVWQATAGEIDKMNHW